jgi:predicted MFS family arabinose efflux permease
MLGLGSAGGLVGSFAAPFLRRRIHSLRLVVAGTVWVDTLLVGLLVLTTNPILLGVLLGLILSLWPLYNAVVQARWMSEIPDALMGRVQSVTAVLAWAPVPLAPLAAGLLLQFTGRIASILCFAAIMFAAAIAATFNRDVKEASADRPTVPAASQN